METPEVKTLISKRITAKGVFTRHGNSLARLMLSKYADKIEEYNTLIPKLHTAYQRFEELHNETITVLEVKEVDVCELEQQAVEQDSIYTDLLVKADRWIKQDTSTNEAEHDSTSSAAANEQWQSKLQQSNENHQREMEQLKLQIESLAQELDKAKLVSTVAHHVASTPLKTSSHVNPGPSGNNVFMHGVGSGNPGYLTTIHEHDENTSMYGDVDERTNSNSRQASSNRLYAVGRGRARNRQPTFVDGGDRVVGNGNRVENRQNVSNIADLSAHFMQQSMLQHQSMMATIHAPTVKLNEFDGSPLKYTAFIQSFNELTNGVAYPDRSKLMVLLNHCVGKAKPVVEACVHLEASEGLSRALRNLRAKFGTPFLIRQAWLERLTNYPTLTSPDVIEAFAYDLECCKHSLQALGQMSELECTNTLQMIVVKLSPPLRLKWRKIHRSIIEREEGSPFQQLVALIRDAADDATDPAYGEEAIAKIRNTYAGVGPATSRSGKGGLTALSKRGSINVASIASNEDADKDLGMEFEDAEIFAISKGATSCAACNSSAHFTFRCFKYRGLTPTDKLELVRRKRLCHLCLSDGHLVTGCPLPWKCQDRDCGAKHHTSLHKAFVRDDTRPAGGTAQKQATHLTTLDQQLDEEKSEGVIDSSVYLTIGAPCLPLTPVNLKNGERVISTYALLDTGSTMTLCTKEIKECLKLESLGVQSANVNTLTNESRLCGDIVQMQISGSDCQDTFEIRRAMTISRLPISIEHVARGSAISKWEHLRDLPVATGTADQVGILIGQNNAHLLEQMEKVTGSNIYDPFGVRTRIGWTVFGNINENPSHQEANHLTISQDTSASQFNLEEFIELEDRRCFADDDDVTTPDEPIMTVTSNSVCEAGLGQVQPVSDPVECSSKDDTEILNEHLTESRDNEMIDEGLNDEEDLGYESVCEECGEECYFSQSQEDEPWEFNWSYNEGQITNDFLDALIRFWKMEEVPISQALSEEDRKVLKLWDDHFRMVDGHVEIPIPFMEGITSMPNNFAMALRALEALGRRLLKNTKELQQYQNVMNKNFEEGYAERVPDDELDFMGIVWYLLHHGVKHPRKPDVTRIVAHGTAKYLGISLATVTYKGPDLMNKLLNVLTRFRQYKHASAADITGMFNQVKVPPPQRNAQRFLYWEDGDPRKKVIVCRMTSHIFGTSWAPAAANYALKKLAQEAAAEVKPEVVESVNKEFYVDDWMNGECEEEESIQRYQDVRDLVRRGNFELGKVTSNSRRMLESVQPSSRAKELAQIDVSRDPLPPGTMLGQWWNPNDDNFGFRFKLEPRPFTRRGMMSCVAELYDPLGLLCPYVLPAKVLMREICKSGASWDQNLPASVGDQWKRWLNDLPKVDVYQVMRWLRCSKTSINTLHHFGDACIIAYGAVTYLVTFEPDTRIYQSLIVSAKSKLAPSTYQTIPRLELGAATLAVKMELALRDCFSVKLQKSRFYSDSDIVLKMLLHDPADFEPFVRNRVSFIKEHTETTQWSFIPGTENPADLASRGCTIDTLNNSELWKFGPDIIRSEKVVCLGHLQLEELPEDFSEFRKKKPVYLAAAGEVTEVVKKRKAEEQMIPGQEKAKEKSKRQSQADLRAPEQIKRKAEEELTVESKVRKIVEVEEKKPVSEKRKREEERPESSRKRCKVDEVKVLEPLIVRYSERIKNVRALAWILRTRRALRTGTWQVGELNVDEIQEAERELVLLNQKLYLKEEQIAGKTCRKLSLRKQDGMWIVGGRLEYSEFADEIKHPWVIPENCPLSRQLIEEAHKAVIHGGVERTYLEVRRGYWLIGGRREVRRQLTRCITCRRHKAPVGEQMMAPLPAHRLTMGQAPFFSTGVDLFGPIAVTVKRSTAKRYGVLYTCFTSRAIHIEVAQDLSTSAFLATFERFIARRGKPTKMHSDNGTNLVGARNKVDEAQKMLENPDIARKLTDKKVQWSLNTPAASHQGGAWERQIRTVRALLTVLLNDVTVDDDKLYTSLCMIEAVINNRPLTRLTDELDADIPLTPAHLLNLRSFYPLFPQDFTADRLKRDWKQAQGLCDLFWQRWMRAYLPELQKRTRWSVEQRNIKKGELVIVVQDCTPRGRWPLAIVKETHPGADGLVRNVTVKLQDTELRRPIQKTVRLEADVG